MESQVGGGGRETDPCTRTDVTAWLHPRRPGQTVHWGQVGLLGMASKSIILATPTWFLSMVHATSFMYGRASNPTTEVGLPCNNPTWAAAHVGLSLWVHMTASGAVLPVKQEAADAVASL